MKIIHEIDSILEELCIFLFQMEEFSFYRLINNARNLIKEDEESGIRSILRMYGGACTFNDLVISKGLIILDEENEKLNTLRTQLFNLCVEALPEVSRNPEKEKS